MNTPTKLSLDDQLCFALFAATNAITRAYEPRLDEIGLTYPQYLVMLVLWQDGDSTVAHIAARLSLPEHAIIAMIKELKYSDFVRLERDGDISDATVISLSKNGKHPEVDAARVWHGVVCQTQMEMNDLMHLRMELMALTRKIEAGTSDDKSSAA